MGCFAKTSSFTLISPSITTSAHNTFIANNSAPLTACYSRLAFLTRHAPPRPVSFIPSRPFSKSGSLYNYRPVDILSCRRSHSRRHLPGISGSLGCRDLFKNHHNDHQQLTCSCLTAQLFSRHNIPPQPQPHRFYHQHYPNYQQQHSHDGRCSKHQARLLKSSLSETALAAAALFVTLAGFIFWQTSEAVAPEDASAASDTSPLRPAGAYVEYYGEPIDLTQYSAGMSLEASSGHVGNLTPDQDEKLKELWFALAKISGVVPEARMSVDDSPSQSREDSLSPASLKKDKRKSRFGSVLGRRKEKVTDDGASEMSVATTYSEDKYGQTKDFQRALAEMTPEQIREWFWSFQKADDPDALLLRFLRARKWNVQNALVMMVSTVRWRGSDIHLDDDLMIKGEQWFADAEKNGTGADQKMGADFMRQLRMGKSFVHGTDKDGRPMCFIRARLHRGGAQSVESLEKLTLHTIETARVMLRPPVETASLVFDLTDFGLANMDYTPVKFMVKVFEANYPESLGHIFVYKAPWIFNGIWKIIRGWLDPVVASKVHFINNAKDLSEFVPPAHIPKDLGGEEDWEYTYIEPVPGENKMMEDTVTRDKLWEERWKIIDQYEKATQEWAEGKGGDELVQQRKELAGQLRDNYWKMDPYIRGKSLYDRQGMIESPSGKITMYPKTLPAWVTGEPTVNGVGHHKKAASVITEATVGEYVDAVEYQ